MTVITKELILQALKAVAVLPNHPDIVTSEAVSSIVIRDNMVGFALDISRIGENDPNEISVACEKAIKSLPGVNKVTIVQTAETVAKQVPKQNKPSSKFTIEGVKRIITIASGKGGVGKSVTTVNLAVSLGQAGYKIAIADADIYGPSISHMMGDVGKANIEGNKIIPFYRHGIKYSSMANLIEPEAAAIWRGPMVSKALYQLLCGTKWGDVDILLIDTPPGTGDIHLSLAENYSLAGSIIVSTPQEIALLDIRKMITMYNKLNVKILGLIENMSYLLNPFTGDKMYLFGEQGVQKLAGEKELRFLGEVPLIQTIREAADAGKPLCLYNNTQEYQQYYNVIAAHIPDLIG